VAFPEDVLSADEHVVLHLHPHWKMMVRPVLVAVLAVVAVAAGFVLLPPGDAGRVGFYVIGTIAVVLVAVFALWPYLVWRTTHYVFTNERVLVQHGVLARDRRDIPLARVNDHAMNQRFAERLLGCGTLLIEAAGERGQVVLADIPDVERVQTTLYKLVEAQHDRHSVGDDEGRAILGERPDHRRIPDHGRLQDRGRLPDRP
jgi:uncharacterized membrane protein YdbT with pleckstrin-like domain